jgi:hypothetical protein
MSVAQVYETQADIFRRPVSFDPADPGHDYADLADVEGQAELSGMLAAAVDTMKSLPPQQQFVLAYHPMRACRWRTSRLACGLPWMR